MGVEEETLEGSSSEECSASHSSIDGSSSNDFGSNDSSSDEGDRSEDALMHIVAVGEDVEVIRDLGVLNTNSVRSDC
ncbi:hypothetical protein SUGI_0595880 [Cryptomeria japonica]|nr:hypothetical protein SUGI_0595880 [Cryptomeria japonica]